MENTVSTTKGKLLRRSLSFFRGRTRSVHGAQQEGEMGRSKGFRRSSPAVFQLTRTSRKKAVALEEDRRDDPPVEPGDEASLNEAMMRTRVMAISERQGEIDDHDEPLFDRFEPDVAASSQCFSSATAILQHSYLELLCGPVDAIEESVYRQKHRLPDDPTVQESIECIFASQLEEGLPHLLLDDDDEYDDEENGEFNYKQEKGTDLVAPSTLQQSLLRSRSETGAYGRQKSQNSRKRKIHSKSLVHVRTFDPSKLEDDSGGGAQRFSSRFGECTCCHQSTPSLAPGEWPQRPLLLRPTPGSGTRLKGIRFSGSSDYIWEAQSSTLTWPSYLKAFWGVTQTPENPANPLDVMCSECMILPINNGNEPPGETLVTDFETSLFEGTLLLRLRYTEGTTSSQYDDSKGYFSGMNRRYQAVVRGKFKKEVPFTQCVTGFQLARRCGKLPPKWILKGAIKVIGFFAPQLQVNFDCDHPTSLAPLGSTPQCIIVQDEKSDLNLEQVHEEPTADAATLLAKASSAGSSLQRARFRKKMFDRLFSQGSVLPKADPSKVYTFEFLQHLFNPQEFSIDLGSMLGSIKLKEMLDGQPLQLMATHGQRRLWSFDLWHELLVDDSKIHDGNKKR